jgi:hypothetical protein
MVAVLCLCISIAAGRAQSGKMPIDAGMAKLFGGNTRFTAALEIQDKQGPSSLEFIPATLAFDEGKSRLEFDLIKALGDKFPEPVLAQMRSAGMTALTIISRPDKQMMYIICPGVKAYTEMALSPEEIATKPDQIQVEATELGKEAINGHDCVKNKVIVTTENGTRQAATVWNASDLKHFPIKVELTRHGHPITAVFKEVKLGTVDKSAFDEPTGYTKYKTFSEMSQQEMLKHLQGH